MASVQKYRQRYLRYHKGYEKRSTTELIKVFKGWFSKIDFTSLQAGSYKTVINNAMDFESLEQAYINIYREVGLVHGKRVGKDINTGLKAFTWGAFLTVFELNVVDYLRRYGVERILTVRRSVFDDIVELISTRLAEGKDMRDVTNEINTLVNRRDFYRWQAERIARTESTAASNYAALQAGDVSGFQMGKEWISATDARTRRKPKSEYDHFEMNGKRVKRNEKFIFNRSKDPRNQLDYPGDPTAYPGNVINCRCTVAIVALRDKDGNLIPK